MSTPPDRQVRAGWDTKLRARGHRLTWKQTAPWPQARHRGACARCGGVIECGTGDASAPADADIREMRRCVPALAVVH